jgi:hypothetical protein
MPEKKGNTLRSHLTFDPTASKRSGQIQKILKNHFLRKIKWTFIIEIKKQKTQF